MLNNVKIEKFCYSRHSNHIKLVVRLFNDKQLNINEFFTLISPICIDPEKRGQFRKYIKETLNYNEAIGIIH